MTGSLVAGLASSSSVASVQQWAVLLHQLSGCHAAEMLQNMDLLFVSALGVQRSVMRCSLSQAVFIL